MKIGAGVSFYQCKDELERCLKSLQGADVIYAIDGKYVSYGDKNKSGLSVDGSRDICKNYSNVKLYDMGNEWQIAKRNKYLIEAAKDNCDIVLIMDSDVWLEGDWELFRENLDRTVRDENGYRYIMPHINNKQDQAVQQNYGRILFRPETMHYAKTHGNIWIGNRRVYPKQNNPIIKGLISYTDMKLRDEERQRLGINFKRVNQTAEARRLIDGLE